MSLIGPRPEWTKEVRILEDSVPHYHLRHFVKPGMTGWAQINFRATASALDSVEKLRYDLYYVKNMTLALDIGILLRTIRRIFQKDSSFSPEKRIV
jgi:lipopolysaccharide/colanic/teichoic acid biosynthesis glycosyltransferase